MCSEIKMVFETVRADNFVHFIKPTCFIKLNTKLNFVSISPRLFKK